MRATRVLIIGPSNIGDAILASHAIAAISRRVPDAHLTLVVGERATALFVDDPRIQTLVDASLFESVLGRLKLALMLWRYRPHILVDLRQTLYPVLLKPWAAWRFFRRPPRSLTHMRDRQLWKVRVQVPEGRSGLRADESTSASAPARRAPPASGGASVMHAPVSFTAKDTSHVEGLWKRWGFANAPRLVIIAPGARSHIKRWTTDGFARVADRLIGEEGAQVVFSGEPDEEPIVEEIRHLMRHRTHSVVGLVTIRQLGLLMARAHLVITNDSASLHLASALNVPTVAIFGPTDATKYGPTAARSRVVRRQLFCSPCEQPLCRFHHECMRFISPEEVYDAAVELLEAKSP